MYVTDPFLSAAVTGCATPPAGFPGFTTLCTTSSATASTARAGITRSVCSRSTSTTSSGCCVATSSGSPTLDPNDYAWWLLVSAPIQRAPVSWYKGGPVYPCSYEQYLWVAKYYHAIDHRPPPPNVYEWAESIDFPDLPQNMLRDAGKCPRYTCADCASVI